MAWIINVFDNTSFIPQSFVLKKRFAIGDAAQYNHSLLHSVCCQDIPTKYTLQQIKIRKMFKICCWWQQQCSSNIRSKFLNGSRFWLSKPQRTEIRWWSFCWHRSLTRSWFVPPPPFFHEYQPLFPRHLHISHPMSEYNMCFLCILWCDIIYETKGACLPSDVDKWWLVAWQHLI